VAPLGTGLTPEQAQLVKRHAPHVILLYDSDEPGLRATFRAGDELLREGLRVSVATLPAGEDPDTLGQKKGAAGIEEILKDAVDVLERKIQILDRRASSARYRDGGARWIGCCPRFGGEDPITRELYIARAAEAAGVRKDVLEREALGAGSGEQYRAAQSREPLPAPRSRFARQRRESPRAAHARRRAMEISRRRGRRPEELEFPPYRAVFESVADDAVLALDDTSARAYEQLKAEGLGRRDPNEMYELAVNWMEARRLERQLEQLDDQLPFESPERQASLIAEKRRVFDELRKRYPRYKIAKRRRGAPGT